MTALLGLELRRLWSAPATWGLLAAATAILGWQFLATADALLVSQEQLAELPGSVTRLLALPVVAHAALVLMVVTVLLAPRAALRSESALAAAPVTDRARVLARWLAHALLLAVIASVALLMAASARWGAAIDLGVLTVAWLALLLLALAAAAIGVMAGVRLATGVLAALACGVALALLWAPDAPALARGVVDSPLAYLSISRRLHPLLNGELALASVIWMLALAALALTLGWALVSRRRPLRRGIAAAVALIAAVAAVALADRSGLRWDVSRGAQNSLSAASRDLLANLDQPVEVVVLQGPGVSAVAIERFVDRYRALLPALTLRWLDPAADADAARRLGLARGEVLVRYGDRETRLGNLSETDFTGALARLATPAEVRLAYVHGGGERDLRGQADHQWGRFGEELARRGIDAVPLDLVLNPVVPDELDALIYVPGEGAPIPGVVEAVIDYLQRGGSLWWVADPGIDRAYLDLQSLLGVTQLPGTVVDARGADHGLTDPRQIRVARFDEVPPVQGLAQPVLLFGAAGWRLTAGPWTSHPILATGPGTWNESGPIVGAIRPDTAGEITGPLTLAAALQQSLEHDTQRVVVVGDSDFLSNRFLGNGGNLELGMRVVYWLLQQEVTVPAYLAPDRRFDLPPLALGLMGLWWLVAVPGGLLAVGAWRWARLRRA